MFWNFFSSDKDNQSNYNSETSSVYNDSDISDRNIKNEEFNNIFTNNNIADITDNNNNKLKYTIKREKLPIVFSADYNISFFGLQCFYPFDTEKGQRVVQYLLMANLISEDKLTKPFEVNEEELLQVHTEQYLDTLRTSEVVSRIAEIPFVSYIPNLIVQTSYLRPMRFQVGGSLRAAKLALREGWAINLGGGFHNCTSDAGGSFSPYSDVTLIINELMLKPEKKLVTHTMIIDLSARQGNGFERDLMDMKNIYIVDMYNQDIYPRDELAKVAINKKVELQSKTEDEVYLRKLRIYLGKAFQEFKPNFIIYIAGTDIVDGDALGELSVSSEGIVARDEYVFTKANTLKIPIVMLLGTGYTRISAQVVASSIINLQQKDLIPSKYWNR